MKKKVISENSENSKINIDMNYAVNRCADIDI